jgi:hypothetical protein
VHREGIHPTSESLPAREAPDKQLPSAFFAALPISTLNNSTNAPLSPLPRSPTISFAISRAYAHSVFKRRSLNCTVIAGPA